jgi:TolA-binding protein
LWAGSAFAAQVVGLELKREQETSRLVLAGDAPLSYQVELADPQTVVLHLKGTSLKPGISTAALGDPLVASVTAQAVGDGLSLVVRTRAPGLTVLPFYDAKSRQLTLEVGGTPALQGAVPAERPAPSPATPVPQAVIEAPPRPPVAATAPPPPPARAASPPAPPLAVIQAPPPPAATPAPAPTPAPVPISARVTGLRLGTHPDHTRLVLEGDGPLRASLAASPTGALLSLPGAAAAPGLKVSGGDERVRGMELSGREPLSLNLRLARPLGQHKLFYLEGGRKLVLDVTLAPVGTKFPAAAPSPPAAQAAPAPVAGPPPVSLPSTTASPAPAPAPAAPIIAPSVAAQARAAALAQVLEAESELPQASEAKPSPGRPGQAVGTMPPIPPPLPLARPITPAPPLAPTREAPPGTQARITQPIQDLPTAPMERGPAAQAPAPSPAPMPPAPGLKPVPAGRPGMDAISDSSARAIFADAKLQLERRNFSQALSGFERLLTQHPHHELAGEATFRLADAYFYLHERGVPPVYFQIMEKYQRGIDLYPDSDQVPWALLMMGKASLLNDEPYKALGYFELVVKDYPKSEYVPVALVSRGQAHMLQGKFEPALKEFEAVAKGFPDSRYRREADWGTAQALFGLARWDRAATLLKDMIARDPRLHQQEPEVLYYLGEALFQMRDYPAARGYLLWGLNIKPEMRDADIILTRVGDTYRYQGEDANAAEVYKHVAATMPESDGAQLARMRLAEKPIKDPNHPWDIFQVEPTVAAQQVYEEVAEKMADRAVGQLASLKLGVFLYKKKDYAKGLDVVEKLIQDHPRTPFKAEAGYTLNLLALGLLDQMKADNQALALMDAYLRYRAYLTKPSGSEALRLLAWAYENTGLNERAARLYKVVMSRGQADPELRLSLGRNLYIGRDYQGVSEVLKESALEGLAVKDETEARSLLGRALARLGRYQRAGEILSVLLEEQPNHPHAAQDFHLLGLSLAETGQGEAAVAALDQAEARLAKQGGPPAKAERQLVARLAGGLAKNAGQSAQATVYFQRALDLATSDVDKAQALYDLSQSRRGEGKNREMAEDLKELVRMQVTPWSSMAARHLADMELAPRLAQVGQ